MTEIIISRQEAISQGLKRYFTGKPCKFGHIDYRTVQSCTCCECNRLNSDIWNKNNRETKCLLWREWYQKNKKVYLLKLTKNREKDPKPFRERFNKWINKNPHYRHIANNKRRALLVKSGGTYNACDVIDLLGKQNKKCVNCNKKISGGYHIDHINPLYLGGDNSKYNIQLLCPKCNLKKGKTDPIIWAQKNGRLL